MSRTCATCRILQGHGRVSACRCQQCKAARFRHRNRILPTGHMQRAGAFLVCPCLLCSSCSLGVCLSVCLLHTPDCVDEQAMDMARGLADKDAESRLARESVCMCASVSLAVCMNVLIFVFWCVFVVVNVHAFKCVRVCARVCVCAGASIPYVHLAYYANTNDRCMFTRLQMCTGCVFTHNVCLCMHLSYCIYTIHEYSLARSLSLFLFLTVSFSHTLSLFVSLLIVYPCRACFHMGCLHNQQGQVQRECGCACVERECARERAREMHMRDSRPS